jgi:hypothetical protein
MVPQSSQTEAPCVQAFAGSAALRVASAAHPKGAVSGPGPYGRACAVTVMVGEQIVVDAWQTLYV